MDLDILVCIPQLNQEKNFRLDSCLLKLSKLEERIRKSVVLPPQIIFQAEENKNAPELDKDQSIMKCFGSRCFNDDVPKMLYIYFSEPTKQENSNQHNSSEPEECIIDQKKPEPAPQEEVKKGIKREILVTILNPYLATNHTFLAKNKLRLSELLELYQQRIGWQIRKGHLFFSSYPSKGRHCLSQTLEEITPDDEITLEVRKETKETKEYRKIRNILNLRVEDDGLEIIEKKFKPDTAAKVKLEQDIIEKYRTKEALANVRNKSQFKKYRTEDNFIEIVEDDEDLCTRFFNGKLFSGELNIIDEKALLDFVLRQLREEDGAPEKNLQFGSILQAMENKGLIKLTIEFVNEPLKEDPCYFKLNARITDCKVLAPERIKHYFMSYYINHFVSHNMVSLKH